MDLPLNTLIKGDCIDVLRTFDDNSIDLILTDPPYGLTTNKKDIKVNLDELFRVGKSVILFSQNPYTSELITKYKKFYRYDLIWNKELKTGFLNAKRMPLRQHEIILIFGNPKYNPQFSIGEPLHSKGKSYKNKEIKNQNYGKFEITEDKRAGETKKYPSSILNFKKPHPSVSVHPTQKPVEIGQYLIKTYTDKNDIILDCFAGSGSFCVAAKLEKRNYIGIEKDLEYCKISEERLKNI